MVQLPALDNAHYFYYFFYICKYYLHTIVQSVTWIDGLFLMNLIFTTQVCCGQLNEVGQLNAVLRYMVINKLKIDFSNSDTTQLQETVH